MAGPTMKNRGPERAQIPGPLTRPLATRLMFLALMNANFYYAFMECILTK